MTESDIIKGIEELKADIAYFSKIDFVNLKQKFERDLKIIETLQANNKVSVNEQTENS